MKLPRNLELSLAILSLAILSLTASAQAPQPTATGPSDLLKAADELTAKVAQLRGLSPLAPIQKGVKSRKEISSFLTEHVRSSVDESDLQAEGETLRWLGLVPATIDYKEFVLELLSEQVGGYYDHEKKTFYIADWLPLDQQRPVMVHELVHALQDQHFGIGEILKANLKRHNDDRLLAQQAIFEGDGMAVMLDYLLEPQGRRFEQLPDLVFIMRAQEGMMETQFPMFRKAPAYLKETLLFPYGYGAAFLQKVRTSKPWSAVDGIYSDLPASTEQVLHPEKYFDKREDPAAVDSGDLAAALGGSWKIAWKNVLGEFTLFVMLKNLIAGEEKAARAAAGWGGDQVVLLQSGKQSIVFIDSVWDTEEDAVQFSAAIAEWLPRRFPQGVRSGESADGLTLTLEGLKHWYNRKGSRVTVCIGAPESESAKLERLP